jgi:hypothetical protein
LAKDTNQWVEQAEVAMKEAGKFRTSRWATRRLLWNVHPHFVKSIDLSQAVVKRAFRAGAYSWYPGRNIKGIATHGISRVLKDESGKMADRCSARYEQLPKAVARYKEMQAEANAAWAESQQKQARGVFDKFTRKAFQKCTTEGVDPANQQAGSLQSYLSACKTVDDAWREAANGYATDEATKQQLSDFLAHYDATLAAVTKAMATAEANEAKCVQLDEAVYTKSDALNWKKCMVKADLSSSARQYSVTSDELYEDYMSKAARSCGKSLKITRRIEKFYSGCVYHGQPATFGGRGVDKWRSGKDRSDLCYDGDKGSICLVNLTEEQLYPE